MMFGRQELNHESQNTEKKLKKQRIEIEFLSTLEDKRRFELMIKDYFSVYNDYYLNVKV